MKTLSVTTGKLISKLFELRVTVTGPIVNIDKFVKYSIVVLWYTGSTIKDVFNEKFFRIKFSIFLPLLSLFSGIIKKSNSLTLNLYRKDDINCQLSEIVSFLNNTWLKLHNKKL